MEANEAPGKIYLQPSVIEHLPHQNIIYTKPLADNSIEYTRTDAFIEKAWNWIEDNLLSSNQQDKSRLYYEQFKKYMKEE